MATSMKILSTVVILMIFAFGMAQLSFAQTTVDASAASSGSSNPVEPAAVSSTAAIQITAATQINAQSAPTTTAVSECQLSDKLMKDYDRLITELSNADSNDAEKAEETTNKIIALKQEIMKSQERCKPEVTEEIITKQGIITKPMASATPAASAVSTKPTTTNRCEEDVEQRELKYSYYTEIYSLPDEDIKNKGYQNREELEKILNQLSDDLVKIKKGCGQEAKTPVLECKSRTCSDGSITKCDTKSIEKCGVNTFGVFNQCDEGFRNVYVACHDGFEAKEEDANSCKSSLDWQNFAKEICEGRCKKNEICSCSNCPEQTNPAIAIQIDSTESEKPTATDSGNEIKDYYKTMIEKITSLKDVDEQMEQLKTLRQEIDNLIEKLLKGKNVITPNDVGDLVEKISINPGEIKADNVQIKTIGKRVLTNLDGNSISIEPTETQVLIKDEDLEIKTDAVSIQENVLRVGDAEVKIAASKLINKLKIKPKEIELKEENGKAVYKISAEENRKLLGFIPVNIKKNLRVDAGNGDVLEERKSWYAFLTTE